MMEAFLNWLNNLSLGGGAAVFLITLIVLGGIYDITMRIISAWEKKGK